LSGSPILNSNGEVIGIYGQGDPNSRGLTFGIPITTYQQLPNRPSIATRPTPRPTPTPTPDAQYTAQASEAIQFYNSAKQKEREGNFRGALVDYDRAIAIDPNSNYVRAYNDRARLKENRLGDFQGALVDYDRAIVLAPNDHVLYRNRGMLKANKLNDVQGALADYNRGISISPNYGLTYNERALLKANRLSDFQGALVDYDRAISLVPNEPIIYYNRAQLKENKLSNFQGALVDYDRAIALNPDYADAYNNRGYLRRDRLDNRSGALDDFNKALSLYRRAGNTEGVNRITTAISQTPQNGIQNFVMRNRSSKVIERVYISASTDDNWGSDRLGRTEVIRPGGSYTFNFTGFSECLFDIKVDFADGSTGEKRNVNLCRVSTFDVSDLGLGQ
jgi:tetratricopeptide (TPR) repeat protein